MLGFAIFVPSDWLHPTTNFKSYGLVCSLRLPRLSLGVPQVCLVAFSSQHSCSLFMHAQLNTPLHVCSLHACFQCICAKLVWTHAPSIHSTKHPKMGREGNSWDHAPFIHPTKHTRHVFGSLLHLWLATLFELHGPHVIDSTSCKILPHLWWPFCQPHFLWQTHFA